MKYIPLVLALLAVVATGQMTPDREFEQVTNGYTLEVLRLDPEFATLIGDHRYDSELTDRSKYGIDTRLENTKRYHERLQTIDRGRLSQANSIDYRILMNQMEWEIFRDEVLREWEWNPLYYNPSGGIYSLVAREFAPLDKRLNSVRGRLGQIPDVVSSARANLKNPPRVHTETAILQNKGSISLIESDLEQFLDQSPEMREAMAPVRERAVAALKEYGEWLENDLLPRSNGEFRLGDEMWQQKLRFTLDSDLSKARILKLAEADLKATQQTMYETALPMYKAYFPDQTDRLDNIKHVCKSVLDRLAESAPDNDSIVELARVSLDEAIEFARAHKLITIPTEPVKLIVMPEFQRGVAVAYCDAPGPMEKHLDTFYAISPTPQEWTEERTASFFREYNDHMVYDLTVHEAVPGHYLQLAHSNKFVATTWIRAMFYSGSFVEGWAVYAERLMAEAGFGGDEVHMQQLKMRLRVIINAIIDQKIHTEGMTETDAVALMMDEGFQEDGEAAGKWRRACLTSTQLSTYFVGSAEVEAIVSDYRKVNGADTDVQVMHDKILSFGSPAAKYVRIHMGL